MGRSREGTYSPGSPKGSQVMETVIPSTHALSGELGHQTPACRWNVIEVHVSFHCHSVASGYLQATSYCKSLKAEVIHIPR